MGTLVSDVNIVTIVVAVIGIFGGGGIWHFFSSRRELPIKRREMEQAIRYQDDQNALEIAKAAQQQAHEAREWAKVQLDDMHRQLAYEREGRALLAERIHKQEVHTVEQDRMINRMRRQLRAFSEAWDDLTQHWATYRLQEEPPPRPTDSN